MCITNEQADFKLFTREPTVLLSNPSFSPNLLDWCWWRHNGPCWGERRLQWSCGATFVPLYQYFGRDPCSRKASLVMAPILKMFCVFRTKFSFPNHRPFKKNISAFLFDISSVLTVGNPEWFLIKIKQNKKLQQPSFKICIWYLSHFILFFWG